MVTKCDSNLSLHVREPESFPSTSHASFPFKEGSPPIPGGPWVALIPLCFPLKSGRTLDQDES